MFSKIDKKILVALIIIIIIVAFLGVATYKYMAQNFVKIQNSAGGSSIKKTEDQKNSEENPKEVQLDLGGIQIEGTNANHSGGLSICLDKCGDGVCQKIDSNCGEGNNLNCICEETPQECPQDCK